MSGLALTDGLRWKEWIPLVTQQQRLRNLRQITAYNICVRGDFQEKKKLIKLSYYYTLHLTAMSAALYTSEFSESENPKWSELEIKCNYGSANGVIIRLWAHVPDDNDCVITVWGVYFSGLIYIGPRLISTDASTLCANSIILYMHGGYFTAPHCLLNPHPLIPRTLSIELGAMQVRPSYPLQLLLKLQSLKQAIKSESQAASDLRDKILEAMSGSPVENTYPSRGSVTLRKLLSKQGPPKANPDEILSAKKDIERMKFKVKLLGELRDMLQLKAQKKLTEKNSIMEKNQDRESELMENFCRLRRESEKKRELKNQLVEYKRELLETNTLVDILRRELISQLSYIYPIAQLPDGRYTIRDVHLPNSEDFEGKDEVMISVALGYVAHLVQMISFFLNVPTRYPICHFGSRSKIIDHITDNLPEKEREFPLYSRGKEKHLFSYGVYLLNKNIAQLRWYYGLTTSDLRHTLPNLQALMHLNKKEDVKRLTEIRKNQKRTGISCSLEQGLNNFAAQEVNSDPQHYTTTGRRMRTETTPPIHDLASLMLLDIPKQGDKNYENDKLPTFSRRSADNIYERTDSSISSGGKLLKDATNNSGMHHLEPSHYQDTKTCVECDKTMSDDSIEIAEDVSINNFLEDNT